MLLVGNGAEPRALDPQIVTGLPEAQIVEALFEGLVARHPSDDGAVEPGVAERWEVSENGRTYTFHLRENARWSNGEPVTANDFVFSYRRMLDPTLGAPYAYFLYRLEGAEAYHKGKTTDFATVGVRAPDPRRLELRLREPTPAFPQMLKHSAWFSVHPPTIERLEAFSASATGWARPGSLIGNGAFVLEAWQPNQAVLLRRSPTYWDAAQVQLDAIRFHPIENSNTELRSYENGQLHVTDTVPATQRERFRRAGRADYHEDVQLATNYLTFNTADPALSDPRVRRALSLAIDREAIRRINGSGLPAHSFTPAAMPDYIPPEAVAYDPEAARALLAEAGYPGGAGLPPIELTVSTNDTARQVGEALQGIWADELGIDVRLRNLEWKVYLDTLNQRAYQIGYLAWFGDYIDPMTFLGLFAADSGNNRTNWTSSDYDALLDAARRERDPAARSALLQRAETLMLEAAPIAPLLYRTSVSLVHPSVRNWHPKLLDLRPWKHIALEP